ncbi:hypothetical protein COCOBI_10-0080 [Coccomyxa sp. Obi]|nr:hypothetical protein COCOBI_10-0080 [Coccomyxa sp. Obi]
MDAIITAIPFGDPGRAIYLFDRIDADHECMGFAQRSNGSETFGIEAPLQEVCSQPSIDSVAQQEGLYTICGSLETGLSREAVLCVLTDYEGLARIYSSIEESKLSVIGRKKSVLQVCRWEFLVFSGTFETKLTVEENLPSGTVVFHLVSSSFMKQFEGRWQVSELADGSCKVEHRLSVEPVLAPPQAFAGYTQKIFVRQVERLLQDLSRELCRIQYH